MPDPVSVLDPSTTRDWLADGATLIDARGLLQRGLRSLPGAARLPWTATRTGGRRSGRVATPEVLAGVFERVGVCWDRPVVVVDAGPSGWGEGARVAWALAWLDHPAVGWLPLLDRPDGLTARVPSPPSRAWSGGLRADWRVEGGLTVADGATVIDVRTAREFSGERRYGEVRGGHIPGARHLPLSSLWSTVGARTPDPVHAALEAARVPPDGPLLCVCTGGVRSAAAMVLLRRALPGRAVLHLDAGMWAWSADLQRPMAQAPAE